MGFKLTLLLVSVQQTADDGGIPEGRARIQLQDALGNSAFFMLTDAADVASVLEVWQPYKAAVDEAIAKDVKVWPDAPLYEVTVGARLP